MKLLAGLLFSILLSNTAQADFTWDTSVFYFSDTFTTGSATQYGLTMWATSLNIEIGKSKNFFFGWNMMGFTQLLSNGTQAQYSSTEMGPRFMYTNKSGNVQIALSYHLSSTNVTTYDPGTGTAAKLKGTAMFIEIGYLPEFSSGWRLGCKLDYYAPSFTESIEGGTTYAQISYTRASIMPALALTAYW